MRRFHREDRGQAIVLIAVAMSTLLLGVGIAVDTGQLYAGRRAVQTAADSAAWAGAVVILTAGSSGFSGATATAAEAASLADALRNGYTITVADVNIPPTTGPVREDPGFVEVIITTNVQTTFFPGPRAVTVRAVAGATRAGSGNAVHVLRGGATANTLDLATSARLDVTGGDIRVNSTGTSIRIAAGGITTPSFATRVAGNPGIAAADAAKVVPAVVPSQAAAADPIGGAAGLPGPSTTALWGAAYGITPAVLTEQGTIDRNSSNAALSQGIYTGGIRLRGTSAVTLNPGVYILRGGGSDYGLTVQNSAQINMASATAAVVIYNTYSNYPAAPGGSPNCGQIDFDTTGQVTLRPATAGSYAGIVIIQDASCPTTDTMRIRNTGARNITGTIYLPNTNLSITSSGAAATLNLAGQFVVWQYDSNPTDVNLTFAPATSAGARVPALVE